MCHVRDVFLRLQGIVGAGADRLPRGGEPGSRPPTTAQNAQLSGMYPACYPELFARAAQWCVGEIEYHVGPAAAAVAAAASAAMSEQGRDCAVVLSLSLPPFIYLSIYK